METQSSDRLVMNYYSRSSSSQPWAYGFSQAQTYVKKRRVVTDTVRRTKPLDGFRFATSRNVSSETRRDSGFTFHAAGDTRIYENYSVLTAYPEDYVFGVLSSGGVWTGSDYGASIKPPSISLNREILYNKIRSSIRGEAVNLANALGEYRQTAKLFLELAQVVATRGRSLIRRHPGVGKARRMVDIPSSAANAHLQFQYGIKPLASDLGTGLGELHSRFQQPIYMQGVVRQRNRIQQTGFVGPSSTVFSTRARVERLFEQHQRTQYRAELNRDVLSNQLARHGLLNPASLAWELMPYSFVIDWWVNVGEVLSSLDNLILIKSLEVIDSTSTRTAAIVSAETRIEKSGDGIYQPGSAFIYKRSDSRSSPTSISRIASLVYKPSMSYQHIANGIALLQQLRR